MIVQEQDIREITGAVWTSVLQVDAAADLGGLTAELPPNALTGCVQISGAWEGAVTLQCSIDLARAAAGTMFDRAPDATSADEIRDALGELANMVGGNIKALLPAPTHLSLPIVVEGDRAALSIRDTEAVQTVWFASHGQPFVVTVLSRVGGQPT